VKQGIHFGGERLRAVPGTRVYKGWTEVGLPTQRDRNDDAVRRLVRERGYYREPRNKLSLSFAKILISREINDLAVRSRA
jgi:hypothetical protein